MYDAANEFSASANRVAADRARAQAARTLVRAAMGSAAVVYRRTWPMAEPVQAMVDLAAGHRLGGDGWLDSTLDLRDGLSVVEVFAAADARLA